jgi:hypothetical protein
MRSALRKLRQHGTVSHSLVTLITLSFYPLLFASTVSIPIRGITSPKAVKRWRLCCYLLPLSWLVCLHSGEVGWTRAGEEERAREAAAIR